MWRTEAWDDLKAAFPNGCMGSKIMITTRNQEIPRYVDPHNSFVYEPRYLTQDEAWVLFSRIALNDIISSKNHENLGREMVEKCGGLPLAAISLSGLLATKKRLDEWEKVNRSIYQSNILEIEAKGLNHPHLVVGKVLLQSYHDLPYYLRPCLLYLGIFPEDFNIPRGILIRMWIAEGFITSEQIRPGETLEEVAEEYANELAKRCLIQVASRAQTGDTKSFRVHDLIRDLCIFISRKQRFVDIFPQSTPNAHNLMLENSEDLTSKPRKISLHFNYPSDMACFIEQQNPNLRSVIVFGSNSVKYGDENLLNMRRQGVYEKFRLLRVLHLWGISIQDDTLSTEVGKLIHLRYLGIWSTQAITLPYSIGFLKNIQTLDYSIFNIKELNFPNVLCNLQKLRHLFLPASCNTDNLDLGSLGDSLQSLWGVKAGNWMLQCLSDLKNIRTLRVIEISTLDQIKAILQFATQTTNNHLKRLHLEWKNNVNWESKSLEALRNCDHLNELFIFGRVKESGPLMLPSSLISLSLSKCELKEHDPMLALAKLPNLEHLRLAYQAFEGLEMRCEANGFPRLEQLEMVKLKKLQEWRIQKGAMPCLKILTIYYCRELRRLPEGLKFITTLKDLKIHSMPRTFCNQLSGEDYHIVKHIHNLDVLPFGL